MSKKSDKLLAAIETLTASIGVYGKRIEQPVWIQWGNGVVLRDHTGMMITAGKEHVAKWIAKNMKDKL
jgi:hypothetical protein